MCPENTRATSEPNVRSHIFRFTSFGRRRVFLTWYFPDVDAEAVFEGLFCSVHCWLIVPSEELNVGASIRVTGGVIAWTFSLPGNEEALVLIRAVCAYMQVCGVHYKCILTWVDELLAPSVGAIHQRQQQEQTLRWSASFFRFFFFFLTSARGHTRSGKDVVSMTSRGGTVSVHTRWLDTVRFYLFFLNPLKSCSAW